MILVEAFALELVQVAQQPEGEEGEAKDTDLHSYSCLPAEIHHCVWQAKNSHPNHGIDAVEECMHLKQSQA